MTNQQLLVLVVTIIGAQFAGYGIITTLLMRVLDARFETLQTQITSLREVMTERLDNIYRRLEALERH